MSKALIQGKFYRVSYNGEGVYEALRKKVGWDWKTVKQDPDINWLPTPEVDEYKDSYRSYFTTLGYKTFQAKTMKVIDKYLDPKKIKVKEYNDIYGSLMYKDQYQVVVDQGDEIMNEKFGITTMDDLVAFRRDLNEYAEEKWFTPPKPDNVIDEEAEYGTNWFISEDDIYLNWDKWENGSAHLVFVNGLSGSGKSTLGRKISENYDAYYVELDVYGWMIVGQKAVDRGCTNYDYIKEKDRKLYEYMKAKHIPPDIFAKIDRWGDIPEETEFKIREIEKYLRWLAFEQDERVVVEGGYTGVVMARNPELWKDTPIIFKGTSVTKSVFRRMIRATKKNGPIEIVNVLKAFKPQYLDHMIPETNASRKAMLSGRDDWKYVKEDTSTKMPNIEFKKSIDGTYNAITYINGHMYRPRAEILILNEEGEILLRKSKDVNQYGTKYNLPGGGFDNPNEKPEDVAFRESCEEVRIVPKEVKYTGIVYISEYGDKVPEWHKRILWPVGIKYVGAISYVCIGTYDKRYNQYIKVKDRQDYIDEYNFYDYNDVKTMLRQEHIEALNMYHEEHNESNMLKEGFTEIEADKSPHTKKKKLDLRKIPTKIADFKDFLRKIKTPEMVMKWFLKVNIRWTPHGGSNDHPFQWPDWLIKQRMGNCFDQSIFLHYFCRAKHIDHKMYLVTWLADNGQGTGHAVPLYKKGDKVYVFAYLRPKMGFIGGPFRSYGEAKKVLNNYFLMYINQFFKAPSTPYSSYLSDDDLANFDKYYNNRKITQTEYIIEGLGKNMRSSHLFKIKVKGFAFPNPLLPTYDCIVMVFRTISTIYNFFAANEEVDIDYGDEVETIEEDSNGIDRKYTRSYRNFDEFCQYIKTPQEVMNWYKINKVKWNKPTPTGEFYKKPITWPDDMVKEKEGDCFDHAIFMHYFCDRNNIDNYIARFVKYRALRVNNRWYFTHHFVCILKTDAGWVGFEYDSMPHNKPWGYDERNAMKSSLIGPYKTKEEAAKFFSDFYDYLFDQYQKNHRYKIDWKYRELIRCKTIFLNTKVINLIDKVYGDKSFTQEEFYNLVKSEMGDTNYEGQGYESGCFFSDILNSVIVGVDKIRSFREENDLLEESKYWSRAELNDTSRKKKFDKIKDFNQFCKEVKSVEEVLNYFIVEKIIWGTIDDKKRVIIWPDELIKTKVGVCFDHSIFFHYFCKNKKIESKICLIAWEDKESGMFFCSHAIPCFKRDGKIFAVIYFRPTLGWMAGPYDSWEDCRDNIKQIHRGMVNYEYYHTDTIAYADYMTDEGMQALDKAYGNPNLNQVDFLLSDRARAIRGTFFAKVRIKGFTFADPRFFMWDILAKMRDLFEISPTSEAALLEEKLSADERRCFGLPKKKKYPMPDEAHVRAAIRFFNHCDPEDEEELARNIKKYMKKYNMKDVNVSDNNRFKKYYHPEESKEEKKPIKEETKPKITDKVISINNEAYDAYLYIRSCVNGARRSLSMLETSAAMGGPVVGMEINDQTVHYSNPGMFIIQYSDGIDTGYGITNDLKTKYFLRHDKKKNKLVKEDYSEFLKDRYFGIYSITQEHRDLWNNLLTSFHENPECLINEDSRILSLYEYFSGRRELVGDQIDYDENFNRVDPLWLDLMYNMKLQDPNKLNIPVINENYNGGDFRKHITLPQGIRKFVSSSLHSNELVLCEDPKGMYLLDENNNLVSRYITQEELEVLTDVI